MFVTIEPKARPCPGVERALVLAEEVLRGGKNLLTVGQLIHNRREVERLCGMGLRQIEPEALDNFLEQGEFVDGYFLVRTHGESEEVLSRVWDCGLQVVDATCPIVRHSQEVVEQHVREGWGIVVVGNREHAEVKGLIARTNGRGVVITSGEDVSDQNLEERTLLLSQTTVDPDVFSEVRRMLSGMVSGLKIVDTTCRFLRIRQSDVTTFASEQDAVVLIGGKNSSNCRLLYNTVRTVNERSFWVEEPREVNRRWFRHAVNLGISGGASTPRWQLEEMRSFLNNHQLEENPKGLKNREGGKFLWWMRKRQKKTK